MRDFFLSLSLALGVVGCGCTEIGCSDGISIHLIQDAERIGEVEVVINDDAERVRCAVDSSTYPCSAQRTSSGIMLSIAGNAAKSFALRLFDQSGEVIAEESVQARLAKDRPNGKGCPPECTSAFVER